MDLKNINLMNDTLFKAFMTHKNNRDLVVDFIHSVTGIEKEILRSGTFVGGEEIPKRRISTKKQMIDFTVNLGNKQRIIIEMNQRKDGSIFDKNDLYAFSVIVELSHKNMKKYPKVILINIDNFNPFKSDKPILTFKIRDEEGNIETEMYESIHLVLDNMNNPKYNIDKEIKKFSEFLKKTDLEEMGREYERDERYMAAIRTVEDLTTDPEFIGYYDYEEAKEQEINAVKEELKEKLKEELKEKLKEEKEKSKNKVKLAREEANIETAKKLLSLGVNTIVQIAEATDLSIEKIEKIKIDLTSKHNNQI